MPRMDGYQATREIRSREASLGLMRIPILALTSHVSNEAKCELAGMDDHLGKPLLPDNLRNKIHTWLEKGAATNQGRAPLKEGL